MYFNMCFLLILSPKVSFTKKLILSFNLNQNIRDNNQNKIWLRFSSGINVAGNQPCLDLGLLKLMMLILGQVRLSKGFAPQG